MMCCENNRGKAFWIKRAIFFPIAITAGVLLFTWVVMLLWNAILPAVIGVKAITFCQALGILVLSKILFGGFKGSHGHNPFHNHHKDFHKKWMHLSEEEREKMKAVWKERHSPEAGNEKCC